MTNFYLLNLRIMLELHRIIEQGGEEQLFFVSTTIEHGNTQVNWRQKCVFSTKMCSLLQRKS